MKANPAAPILRTLVALGSAFDVASPAEIDACLAAGAVPADLSFGNTIKKRATSLTRTAAASPASPSTRDAELDKVARHTRRAPTCACACFHDGGEADWPLSRKFGCDHARCPRPR